MPSTPTLLLVNPRTKHHHFATQDDLAPILQRSVTITPLALPLIAALTPESWEVRIVDEEFDQLDFDEVPTLVGITTTSAAIGRAFEIARECRRRGGRVVLGGPAATFMIDESLEHADAVVAGEAEGVWERLLGDALTDSLEPVYRSEEVVQFETSPIPRWDLLDTNQIVSLGVEVSRGCPYDCDFCIVTKTFGRKQRYRKIDDVVVELEALPHKRFIFVDDNLTANKRYSRELFERIAPLGLTWVCQASIDIGKYDDILELMARAGCMSIIIGFESLKPESLAESRKRQNKVERYEEVIARIQSHGIHAIGSFIIGFDSDTDEDLAHIVEFVRKNSLLNSMLSILSAPAGTEIEKRMRAEDRLLPVPPELKCGVFPTLVYNNFSTLEMLDAYYEAAAKMKDLEAVGEMALRLFSKGTFNRLQVRGVGVGQKLRSSIVLLQRYLFTRDVRRRRLLNDLWTLHRAGKLGINEMVVFLTTQAGYDDFFERAHEWLPKVREQLIEIDRPALRRGGSCDG